MFVGAKDTSGHLHGPQTWSSHTWSSSKFNLADKPTGLCPFADRTRFRTTCKTCPTCKRLYIDGVGHISKDVCILLVHRSWEQLRTVCGGVSRRCFWRLPFFSKDPYSSFARRTCSYIAFTPAKPDWALFYPLFYIDYGVSVCVQKFFWLFNLPFLLHANRSTYVWRPRSAFAVQSRAASRSSFNQTARQQLQCSEVLFASSRKCQKLWERERESEIKFANSKQVPFFLVSCDCWCV